MGDIGYRAYPFDAQVRERLARLRKLSLTRILANGDMTSDIDQLMRLASLLLTLPVVLYSARPFFASAWREVRLRRLSMDTPVALGVSAAFIASSTAILIGHGEVYFDSVTMFVFFLLVGRYLEGQARQRAATRLEIATRSLPAAAVRLPDYPALRGGDYVIIRPGDTIIPANGIVVEGVSEVNESLLSGESAPVAKQVGTALIAGVSGKCYCHLAVATKPHPLLSHDF